MNKRRAEVTGADRIVPDRVVLVMAAILCIGSVLFLSWLLWRHPAVQAILIVTGGGQLSLLARLSVTMSNWFVRLLPLAMPFVLLVGAGGFLLAGFAWVWVRTEPRRALLCTAMFLGVGLAVAFASTLIIVSTHIPVELVKELVDKGPTAP